MTGVRPVPVEVAAVTRDVDGRPFVRLVVGPTPILLDVDEARHLAHTILDLAASGEMESALVRAVRTLGLDVDPSDLVQRVIKERTILRGAVN